MKCLRCTFYKREPKETGKLIDGIPVCADCMLQDAKNNRGRVIDYSFLKEVAAPATTPGEYVCPVCQKKCKSEFGLKSHMRSHEE
jgi:hypothetical protein